MGLEVQSGMPKTRIGSVASSGAGGPKAVFRECVISALRHPHIRSAKAICDEAACAEKSSKHLNLAIR